MARENSQSGIELTQLDQLNAVRPTAPGTSCRILDIPCKVCGDYSSGKHYNIFACDGCAGFFKRSIRRSRTYVCKSKEEGTCVIDKTHRNQCRACRLQKCQEAGMNKDAVQHERGPRNTTLRRQHFSNFLLENREKFMMAARGEIMSLPKHFPRFPLVSPQGYFDHSMLTAPRLPPLPLGPLFPHTHIVCEIAARLIIWNVQCLKQIPIMRILPLADQDLLVEESWVELFVIAAAQFLPVEDFSPFVNISGILQSEERHIAFIKGVQEFQHLLSEIRQLHLDTHEFMNIRTLVLFKSNFSKPHSTRMKILLDPAKVITVQEETQITMKTYIQTTYPSQPARFGKVLTILSQLRKINGSTIEDLFFRKTIHQTPIEIIVSGMYRTMPIEP